MTQNAPVKPYVNFAERDFNLTLSVEKVLEKLKRWMPQQYNLAEVVGKWVWVTFTEPPAERVRAELSQPWFPLEQHPQMLAAPLRGDPPARNTGTSRKIRSLVSERHRRLAPEERSRLKHLNKPPHETLGHGWLS